FLQILSRPASPAELQLCEQVYEQQVMAASVTTQDVTTQDVTAARHRAMSSIVRALLNHNDFITIR
ncbi:MAG: hypothetical protein KDA91_25645, partial [Planctomycetaceae bacterium]|nr:hypothetical protein [Planctomycetaceae bacterium]